MVYRVCLDCELCRSLHCPKVTNTTYTMANFKASDLWKVPEINPINRKARSIPILNTINLYGRVFFFSWF